MTTSSASVSKSDLPKYCDLGIYHSNTLVLVMQRFKKAWSRICRRFASCDIWIENKADSQAEEAADCGQAAELGKGLKCSMATVAIEYTEKMPQSLKSFK